MLNPAAFLDASILYSAPLRDLLMELALGGACRPKWSNRVQDEWINALLRNRPDLTRAQLERTRRRMNAHILDALVVDFERWIDGLELPDPNDRHVLAAAIKGEADFIITFNLRDFPADALAPWGIRAQHPDEFLAQRFHMKPSAFLRAARTTRSRLNNPPKSVEEYLGILRAQGLPATVKEIAAFDQFI